MRHRDSVKVGLFLPLCAYAFAGVFAVGRLDPEGPPTVATIFGQAVLTCAVAGLIGYVILLVRGHRTISPFVAAFVAATTWMTLMAWANRAI